MFRYEAHVRPSSQSQDYTFKVPDWPGMYEQQGESLNGQLEQYEYLIIREGTRMNSTARISRCTGWESLRSDAEKATGRVIRRSCGRERVVYADGASAEDAETVNGRWYEHSVRSIRQPQALHGSQGRGTAGQSVGEVIPADRRGVHGCKANRRWTGHRAPLSPGLRGRGNLL